MKRTYTVLGLLCIATATAAARPAHAQAPYPGTAPLTMEGDIASQLVEGVDRFLLGELEKSIVRREDHWNRKFATRQAYLESIALNRARLAHILGVRDERVAFDGLPLVASTSQSAIVGRGQGFVAYAARWPVLRDMHAEGLLLLPNVDTPVADVVALPDADQTPEMIAGLAEGLDPQAQFARRLAESGCRVLIPTLISREMQPRGRRALSNREYLYRSAFELGRHLIGYELQKVFAGIDWFEKQAGEADPNIGVFGYGEGGMLALYAGALDKRIDTTAVSGFFGSRQNIWQEPIDRNVFGLLEQFGGAELATLVAPRQLLVEACRGPELELPGEGGAPARLVSPTLLDAREEAARFDALAGAQIGARIIITFSGEDGQGPPGSPRALADFLLSLNKSAKLAPLGAAPVSERQKFDPAARQARQIHEIDDHNQWLLRESPYVRAEFMKNLDTGTLEKYEKSIEPYRDFFAEDVIGRFKYDLLPPRPRSRQAYNEEKWTGYEVVLDVYPDVIAYGILLVPKNIQPDEMRPVVVCQHGLEGRPQDVVTGDHRAYHDFAAKLAERGFITFAPQNLYIFQDRFRTLQRKANPLKKTLFSVIVPQHQQIVNWLKSLPIVDGERIGFYGLSYGGKSAMRIPPLVTDYALSICSADFNEWVWKNASTRARYSYVWTGEYEIFEFDLGSTFNYSEMAALIAPRPFMVERGHFDGVAPDEMVGYEFAKVRHLYAARLGIADRAEIEWFYGPYKGIHTINGQGTFAFLHKHLNWPAPEAESGE